MLFFFLFVQNDFTFFSFCFVYDQVQAKKMYKTLWNHNSNNVNNVNEMTEFVLLFIFIERQGKRSSFK